MGPANAAIHPAGSDEFGFESWFFHGQPSASGGNEPWSFVPLILWWGFKGVYDRNHDGDGKPAGEALSGFSCQRTWVR